MTKIAIVGKLEHNRTLLRTARALGWQTVFLEVEACADEGADECDRYYRIAPNDVETGVSICRKEKVDGVCSHIEIRDVIFAARIAERLGLVCVPAQTLVSIRDKSWVRERTKTVEGLAVPRTWIYKGGPPPCTFPVVVKPVRGRGKTGVSFAGSAAELSAALAYARTTGEDALIEEFIEGEEFSVESISFGGRHLVVQITGRTSCGAPHFAELFCWSPTSFPADVVRHVEVVVPRILEAIGFTNGPTHIEMKLTPGGDLYLIEVNPRGGGGAIALYLVSLTTNVNFSQAVLEAAVGKFVPPRRLDRQVRCAGEICLCKETEHLRDLLLHADRFGWFFESAIWGDVRGPLAKMVYTNECAGRFVYAAKRHPDFERLVRERAWESWWRCLAKPFFKRRRKWRMRHWV